MARRTSVLPTYELHAAEPLMHLLPLGLRGWDKQGSEVASPRLYKAAGRYTGQAFWAFAAGVQERRDAGGRGVHGWQQADSVVSVPAGGR